MFHDLVFLYLSFFVCGTDGRADDPPAHLLGNCDERAAIIVCFVFPRHICVVVIWARIVAISISRVGGPYKRGTDLRARASAMLPADGRHAAPCRRSRWDKDRDIHLARIIRGPTSVFSRGILDLRGWDGGGASLVARDCTTQCGLWALVLRRQEAMCHLNTRLACVAGLVGCTKEPRPYPRWRGERVLPLWEEGGVRCVRH